MWSKDKPKKKKKEGITRDSFNSTVMRAPAVPAGKMVQRPVAFPPALESVWVLDGEGLTASLQNRDQPGSSQARISFC